MTLRVNAEDGAIGGLEVLPFGLLIFVVGTLVIANAWGVVDAKLATGAAAREAVRAFVETPEGEDPADRARTAATDAMRAQGRQGAVAIRLASGTFQRCSPVTMEVGYQVPGIVVPWVGGLGRTEVVSSATEVVDPLRAGVPGEVDCLAP